MADALVKQQAMADTLTADTSQEDALTAQVSATEDRISALQTEVAALDVRIQDTQDRITVEQGEIGARARALARRPNSVVLVLARSRSLEDALRNGTELMVAGQRAHDVKVRLEADLAKLQADRTARQDDLELETALEASLQSSLDALSGQIAREQDLAAALDDLLTQFQGALDGLTGQSAEDTQALLDLLEQQWRSLNAASVSSAWGAASVGAGSVQLLGSLPHDVSSGRFTVPIAGAVLTQPFGPTDFWFEPPLGKYPHFHTGLDLAAAAGTPVVAAADGVVSAVGSTRGGYGNFVVIAHGDDLMTLYGHLQASVVKVGETVHAGQTIGLEGSTGFSTGPHLHFEVRVKNSVVDPAGYLAVGPRSANSVAPSAVGGPVDTPVAGPVAGPVGPVSPVEVGVGPIP